MNRADQISADDNCDNVNRISMEAESVSPVAFLTGVYMQIKTKRV